MNYPLPLLQTDPRAAYAAHKSEIDAAIKKVLESGWYILGSEVEAFEKEFARYIGVSSAVGVASGTDAIDISLRALNISEHDLVFTVSHTAVATVAAIERAGATPCFVDIDPATYTIDVNKLETGVKRYCRKNTGGHAIPKVIIPVHLYGHPADMNAIKTIADRYNLRIIEDCAQAHGSELMGDKVGSFGHFAAFSFYPTKNLGAVGDGGMVVTDSSEYSEKLRSLRQYGWKERYISSFSGINSRLDEVQAAILRVKLKYLDEENARRREIADAYAAVLQGSLIRPPQISEKIRHVFHQYVVQTSRRDDLIKYLQSKSIATGIHYPMPVHLQPAYKNKFLIASDGLEQTERICKIILSLPIHPQMTAESVDYISKTLREWSG